MSHVFDNNKPGAVGEYLKKNIKPKARTDFVSSIFTIYAYDKLKESLDQAKHVRFLYNEPAFLNRESSVQDKDVKEFQLNMRSREKSVSEFDLEITLKNNLDQNQVASRFHDFVKKRAEVRSVLKPNTVQTKHFYVKNEDEDNFLITGANLDFSLEGLGYKNRVMFDFKTLDKNEETHQQFESFFDKIWNDDSITKDVKEELLSHIKNLYKENSPELLYYVTLYNLFYESLVNEDDISKIKERTGIQKTKIWNMLYNFQHDAVVGAIKKLELFNGCIIADSVGLGKTFEALAIMKYYELRNDRIMVIAPKKLRGNWTSFKQNTKSNLLVEDRFNYDVLNHTDLSREDGYSGDIDLSQINWGNYDLVVIDESHNFRNRPNAPDRKTRYQKLMDDIIKSGVKTKVLMLSATPVNNRLADLKNQIMFITEGDDKAFKDNVGINSIERTLTLAQRRFNEWGALPEDERITENLLTMLDYDFFNLLNTLTIARSRKHIQKYYDTKEIGDFPERLKPKTIKSDIDTEGIFPSLKDINGQIAKLTLPIYSPMLYLLPTKINEYEEKYAQSVQGGKSTFKQADRERNLVNLMRVNILKRLESSVHSFRLTVSRVLNQIDNALNHLEDASMNSYADDFNEFDDEEIEDVEFGNKIKVKMNDMDQIKFKQDLVDDKKILEQLMADARKVSFEKDAKLKDIKHAITEKINRPINQDNRKILVFTSFSDTAEYLYEHLASWVKESFDIHTGLVTGSSALKTNVPGVKNRFEEILLHFSPKASKVDLKRPEIDLLIATDCISEGQNLQDCDYVINYDIHWNPVRIIQRFGRIDRIGSTNKQIQLVNFWPNMELDEYINLEARVKNRMVMLDVSATGDDDLLTAESKDLLYRKEQLNKLQDQVMDLEDLSNSISITDLTLDDFILSLDRFMKEHPGVLEDYPTGIHAVTDVPDKLQEDTVEGAIFCLKQIRYDANEKAANSLYPYYLIYVASDGTIHIGNKSPKSILDIYKAICSGKNEVIKPLVDSFNRETKNGNKMDKYTDLLEKAVFNIKGVVEEKGVKSLFKVGKSTLTDNKVKGLNDFELVTFLVVKP